MTEEDEEFDRIAAKCKETQRVNESKWHSEMCSNYGGFCKKEWVGLTAEDMKDERTHNFDFIHGARWAEKILMERNT
jgi:hypothetical protein